MSLRDLFIAQKLPVLQVATLRECNMQHSYISDATNHATSAQHECEDASLPTVSGATNHATFVQQQLKTNVAWREQLQEHAQPDATLDIATDEGNQDLPLLAAVVEFDTLIERLCDLSKYPADVREEMRQVLKKMAPVNVLDELNAVREQVRTLEAGEKAATADDRITCRECSNRRAYDGLCKIATPGGIVNAVRTYEPDALLPHRCAGFAPEPNATDQRSGLARWPDLDG